MIYLFLFFVPAQYVLIKIYVVCTEGIRDADEAFSILCFYFAFNI